MYSLWDVLCMCVRDECGMTLCKDRGTLHAGRTNIRYFINSSNHIHNSCSSLSDSLGFIHRAVDDETNTSFFLILIDSIRVCPSSLIFLYLFLFCFFFYTESLIFQAPTTQIENESILLRPIFLFLLLLLLLLGCKGGSDGLNNERSKKGRR